MDFRSPSQAVLAQVRAALRARNLQALIIPSEDAHQSEYTASADKMVHRACSFSGSAGTAVVTASMALLWTDGRYYEQAQQELREGWELVRAADPGATTVAQFLARHLHGGDRVAVHGDVVPVAKAIDWDKTMRKGNACCRGVMERKRGETCTEKECVLLTPLEEDLVAGGWEERPQRPAREVVGQGMEDAGKSSREKVEEIRKEMAENKADAIVLAALDEIAWTLNLRGGDILYTPVFFSYLVITQSRMVLIVQNHAIVEGSPVHEYLSNEVGCEVKFEYANRRSFPQLFESIFLPDDRKQSKKRPKIERDEQGDGLNEEEEKVRVWLDPETCSINLQLDCEYSGKVSIFHKQSPVKVAKAMKNEREIEGMRRAHLLEGAALCKFFAWLEREASKNEQQLDELTASQKIESFRELEETYRGPSFKTISAFGPNGSIVHYSVSEDSSRRIGTDSLYLCDTGGQYTSGTTDMTRTMCLGSGEPTSFQKLAFTLVLEGHIALANAVFKEGTEPTKLDLIARLPLWKHGLDYKHGTSHGLGAFLGVHEYPPLMHSGVKSGETAYNGKFSTTSMREGMVLSNEPGFYMANEFGIRIENVMVTVPRKDLPYGHFDETVNWLGFDTITVVPIQPKMVDLSVLSDDGLDWLNRYHAFCREKLAPILKESDPDTYAWVEEQTKPLSR